MLGRSKSTMRKVLRDLASLPLRSLGEQQRSEVVEGLLASMISRVEADGHTLRFLAATPLLLGRARSVLSKEPDTIRWIGQIGAAEVLWDIGANVGVYTIYAAAVRGARVLAFEPSADNYMVLCKNVEINALADLVTPYCVALAGNTGLGVLNSQSRAMGGALHQFGEPGDTSRYWPAKNGLHAQGMLGFSIDDFIQKFSPPFPAHLKIDVDGLELNILQGAAATLRDPRLRSVMVELSMSDANERDRGMALMSEAGLQLVSRGDLQEAAGSVAANHLFVRAGG
jgi:FkbM family methyltransferase